MRNEAPVIQLDEWARHTNAETRGFMGVSVAPEIPERQQVRAYLAGLMSDQEAAACVAADLERVRGDRYPDPRQSPGDGSKNSSAEIAAKDLPEPLPSGFKSEAVELHPNSTVWAVPDIPDDHYAGLPSTFAAACRRADQKQRRKPPDPIIESARRLLADDVTLERAWAELSKPAGVAASTIKAAKYLVRAGDPEQLQRWLAKRSTDEREAILRHFEQRKRMQPA